MIRSARRSTGMSLLKLVPLPVLCAALAGCSMGDLALSGPQVTQQTVAVNLQGQVHGGQQGISYSTLKLYAAGSGSYGAAATLLTRPLTGATQYYPGGATGCLVAANTITAYAIVGGTATFTAANSMIVGQLVKIADSSALNGATALVTAVTATTFSVATTAANAAGVDSGTATPVCYNYPTSDVNGNFNITGDSPCGTNGNSITYLLATGGNPGFSPITASNSAIALAAPLGKCSGLSSATQVTVNELTTAAMAYAMGQYFTTTFGSASTDSFGAPSSTQAQTGLTNAYGTFGNLAQIASGFAVQSATLTGAGDTITVTPEWQKLNTVADILAACVNSQGPSDPSGQCTTLFGNVAPSTSTAPTDILQAAVYLSLNPTSTTTAINNLYNLLPSNLPFVGTTALPTDWTIGILYTDTTSTAAVITDAQSIAADASGNIWVTNNGSGTYGALGELSPTGTPLVGTNFPAATGGPITALNPRNMAIDTNGNVWVPTSSSSGYLYEYVPGTATATGLALGKSPYGIAIDGNNNVFVGKQSASSTIEIQEFLSGNLSVNYEVNYPIVGQSAVGTYSTNVDLPEYMAVDPNGALWFTTGSASTTATSVYALTNINTSSCGATPFTAACSVPSSSTTNTYTAVTTGAEPYGIAANSASMWVANTAGNNLTSLPLTLAAGTNYGSSSSVSGPHFPVVDGSGNVWISNKTTGAVSEFTSGGAVLSPGVGFTHNGISGALGITVDPSGNVWVANNVATGGSNDPNSVFEIVGVASPTVTPLALQLKNSSVATKP